MNWTESNMCSYDEAFTIAEMLEETGLCKKCKLNCPNAGKNESKSMNNYCIDMKWLLNYVNALPENTPSQLQTRFALINMIVAWQKEQASRANN